MGTTSHTPAGTRRRRRIEGAAVRRLVAATAVAGTLALVPAGAASGAECTGSTLVPRLLCGGSAPAPTTTTTTTPVAASTVTAPTLAPVTVPPAAALASTPRVVPEAARRLLELANAERRQGGLGPLAWRDDAAAIAVAHSLRMTATGDLFHNDGYFSVATRSSLNAAALGENVAYNGTVDDAHRRLMASPPHRANLLDRRFSAVGMGVVLAPDGRYFVTQDFLQPAGAAPAPQPAAAAPAPAPRRPAARRAPATAPPVTAPPTTAAPAPPPPTTEAPAPPPPVEVASVLAAPHPLAATQLPARSTPGPTLAVGALAAGVVAVAARGCWALRRRRSS